MKSNAKHLGQITSLILLLLFPHSLSSIAFAQSETNTSEAKAAALKEISEAIDQASKLEVEGQIDAALPLAERALAIGEQKLGADDTFLIIPLMSLARLSVRKGDDKRALPLYQRALLLTEKMRGAEHPHVAVVLDSIANLYLQRDDYAQAEPLFQRSLAIREKSLGAEHEDVAYALESLGRVYEGKGEFERAKPLLQRALAIREKVLGAEHRDVATSLNMLASLYFSQSDYVQAEPLFARALAIREKALGAEHPVVAVSLNNLAELYRDKGDYARAEQTYRRALAIMEKSFGAEHPQVAVVLNNMASLYMRMGDYSQAADLSRRALSIREKILGAEHPLFAQSLTNLALLYSDMGDYAQAETLSRRALALAEKIYSAEHPKTARYLVNMATIFEAKGDYERAEQMYTRALAIDEKAFGAEHLEVATDLNNLAVLYWRQQDYERALPLHQRALAIREKALGEAHPDVLASRNNLSVLYSDRGEYALAEPLLQSTLSAREKTLGAEHPDVGTSLNNLAAFYHKRGDLERAAQLYLRALAIYEKALGPTHPDTATCLFNLAILNSEKKDRAQTLRYLHRGTEIRERNLNLILSTGSEQQKLRYVETLYGETNAIVSLHAHTSPDDAEMAKLSLTTILQRKGRALDAMSNQVNALRGRLDEQDRALLDQLSATRSQLALLSFKSAGAADAATRQSEVAKLEAELERLERAVSSRSAEFRARSQPVTLERVQQSIPAKAALVELMLYRPFKPRGKTDKETWGAARYIAYVLRHDGAPAWVDLGEAAQIDNQAQALRVALADPLRADIKQAARALDEKLMRPVRKLLGETSTVLLSPDGALNLVPFAALVDEQNRYLVESYSFTYLTSGRDLLRLQVGAASANEPVIFANPLFAVTSAQTANQTVAPVTQRELLQSPLGFLTQVRFKQLPGSDAEARAINALLPRSVILTGDKATEAAIKKLSRPGILHIATHGFFLVDQTARLERGLEMAAASNATPTRKENPLLRSGLIFAGVNDKREGRNEDGILTALEVAGLNLWGTRLVVLSACETGVGDVRNGDGVYGLRRALTLAGAESQVMSLWQVSDVATRELMVAYYKRLQTGAGRSDALRQVQLDMLASRHFKHPYYWASFIPAGAWTALNEKPVATPVKKQANQK